MCFIATCDNYLKVTRDPEAEDGSALEEDCEGWRGCGGRGPGRGGRGLHLRPGAARPEEGGQAAAANKQGRVGVCHGLLCFFLEYTFKVPEK